MFKTMMFACFAVAAVPTAATAQSATGQSTSTASAPTKKAGDADRVVCRTEDVVGSILKKNKICMTVAQWRDVSRQSGDWLEKRTSMKGARGE